jgi:hypothetical protein
LSVFLSFELILSNKCIIIHHHHSDFVFKCFGSKIVLSSNYPIFPFHLFQVFFISTYLFSLKTIVFVFIKRKIMFGKDSFYYSSLSRFPCLPLFNPCVIFFEK